jgi:hypothetical protein
MKVILIPSVGTVCSGISLKMFFFVNNEE